MEQNRQSQQHRYRVRIAISILGGGLALVVGLFGLGILGLSLAFSAPSSQWEPWEVVFVLVWLVASLAIPIGTIYALIRWVRKAKPSASVDPGRSGTLPSWGNIIGTNLGVLAVVIGPLIWSISQDVNTQWLADQRGDDIPVQGVVIGVTDGERFEGWFTNEVSSIPTVIHEIHYQYEGTEYTTSWHYDRSTAPIRNPGDTLTLYVDPEYPTIESALPPPPGTSFIRRTANIAAVATLLVALVWEIVWLRRKARPRVT